VLGWLLTIEGRAVRCDVPDIGDAVECGLRSDLIDYTNIGPGVDVWRDLTASVTGKPLNAAAIGLVDYMLDQTAAMLPRIHGNAFICSHDEWGQPVGIGPEGWATLCKFFPQLDQKLSEECD